MMDGFKIYLENEEEENVKGMISKLPKGHQALLKGYKFKYTPGNTLKGDDEHIGYIHKDRIVVAAPWNYSREMVTLHEIAHLVFEKLVTKELKKEWSALVAKTHKKQIADQHPRNQTALKQNDEEIFAMAYAATYAKHPPKTYLHAEWQKFIKKLPS